jgi:integrase
MPRIAKGTVTYVPAKVGEQHGHYAIRVTMADGSRPWFHLDPSPRSEYAEQRAKEKAAEYTERARRDGVVAVPKRERQVNRALPGSPEETCADWFQRFHAHKEGLGRDSVGDMRSRVANWVAPTIGHKLMGAVTREDVEAIVARLDHAILAWQEADGERGDGRISPSTAANVWGDLVHAFDEAVSSKNKSLRVLTSSPCASVRGPETGADREGPILYSDEIVALLRGKAVDEGEPDVPPYRRRVWAAAFYEKARRSELAAFLPADVDLVHDTISITKQVDRKRKKRDPKATKKTKTKRSRTVDIEPNVRELFERLVAHPEGMGGRLLRMPPSEDYAELLRKDLWTVGARDPRLHTEDSTRTKMTGHCLRDTGLTHMAVRGDSPIAIQWAAGHTDFKMTQGYIDRGRVEARRIGQPLPPLPPEVLAGLPPVPPQGAGQNGRNESSAIVRGAPSVAQLRPGSHPLNGSAKSKTLEETSTPLPAFSPSIPVGVAPVCV